MCLSLWLDAQGGSIIQVIRLEPPGGRPVWAAAEMATGLVAGMAGNWKLSPSISQR